MTGIFVSRGIAPVIPKDGFTLSLGPDGKSQASLTLHVHYDVCPIWLDIAVRHLTDAEERMLARVAAWQAENQDARAITLEREFESSMQAIMAAAIAVESFYLALRDKTSIPNHTIQTWQEKRIAQYKRVAEVLRQAFSLSPRGSVHLRNNLKEIFRFRNLAVHPSGDAAAAVNHPELQTGVEWRFAVFRAANAKAIVQVAQSIILELVTTGNPSTPEILRYAEGLKSLLTTRLVQSP